MEIKVVRYSHGIESTLGLVFIDGVFECYCLEDEYRTVKVWGQTRIPNGTYNISVKTTGGHHEKYKKYDFHKGMLHILNVENFTDVLIHIGNDDDDTAACLLTGDLANNNHIETGFISKSTQAYKRLYKKVVNEALNNNLTIQYTSI